VRRYLWTLVPRARYALLVKPTVGWRARARAFWHFVVLAYAYEVCARCGRPVGCVWHAPDDLWLAVNGQDAGVLCPQCFSSGAQELGHFVRFEVRPL
jgi:DNA-directed RNA polymerase subunit RPC12/RpoP